MADLVSNRKVYHDYEILETLEVGMVLQGTEIKSLKDNGASLQEAYVKIIHGELWLIGGYIPHYKFGNIHNHEERRDRKLLAHSYEVRKLQEAIKEKGLTIVPVSIYLSKGKAKMKIATARGKKLHDKRASIRERDEKRRMQAVQKHHC